jgi:hypothetical protein
VETTRRRRKHANAIGETTRIKESQLRKRLESLSDEDMKQFESALAEAIRPRDKGRDQPPNRIR